jgi:hypothetical protein
MMERRGALRELRGCASSRQLLLMVFFLYANQRRMGACHARTRNEAEWLQEDISASEHNSPE